MNANRSFLYSDSGHEQLGRSSPRASAYSRTAPAATDGPGHVQIEITLLTFAGKCGGLGRERTLGGALAVPAQPSIASFASDASQARQCRPPPLERKYRRVMAFNCSGDAASIVVIPLEQDLTRRGKWRMRSDENSLILSPRPPALPAWDLFLVVGSRFSKFRPNRRSTLATTVQAAAAGQVPRRLQLRGG